MNLKRRLFYLLRGSFHFRFGFPRRINLAELFRRAANVGFKFAKDRRDIIWLCDRLKDEAASGRVILWGRPTEIIQRHLIGFGPHEPIPEAHWAKYAVDWITFTEFKSANGWIEGLSDNNAEYSSYRLKASNEGRYWDLMIYDAHASAFIGDAWAARPKGVGVPLERVVD